MWNDALDDSRIRALVAETPQVTARVRRALAPRGGRQRRAGAPARRRGARAWPPTRDELLRRLDAEGRPWIGASSSPTTSRSSGSTSRRCSRPTATWWSARPRAVTTRSASSASTDPDLALLDVKMPGLDGIEVARAVAGGPHQGRAAHGVQPALADRERARRRGRRVPGQAVSLERDPAEAGGDPSTRRSTASASRPDGPRRRQDRDARGRRAGQGVADGATAGWTSRRRSR